MLLSELYASPAFPLSITGGLSTEADTWEPLRTFSALSDPCPTPDRVLPTLVPKYGEHHLSFILIISALVCALLQTIL